MAYYSAQPLTNTRYGTIDPSQYGRTGSPYTDPDFLKLYIAQLDQQSFDILFGEEGMNNSIFGDSSVFGAAPSSTSSLFGGAGSAMMPTDISGAGTNINGSQYFALIAQANLIGKTVTAYDSQTGKEFSGEVASVSVERGSLQINIRKESGEVVSVPPERLIDISK